MKKIKVISLILAALFVIMLCPGLALAEDNEEGPVEQEEIMPAEYPVITLGAWQQDEDLTTSDPIEWLVLENDGKKALLLTKSILMIDHFNYVYGNASGKVWSKSTLRSFLNKNFLQQAFSKEEQKAILSASVSNSVNPETGVKGGSSKDKLFLLSWEEVKKYFPTQESRIAYTTWFCDQTSGSPKEEAVHAQSWWLRTPGINIATALSIEADGSTNVKNGLQQVFKNGVRIAMCVDPRKLPEME